MKIAIIGYGKMGKIIDKIAKERGHEIVAIFNSNNLLSSEKLNEAQIAIEFSKPNLAVDHITLCAQNNIPIVVGTTAWSDKFEKVEKTIAESNTGLLYASNFSLGVNLFFELNKHLAKIMSKHSAYKVSLSETHHVEKIDAPSGTAVSLCGDIIENHEAYQNWTLREGSTCPENFIPVDAIRKPHVPGTHEISYTSEIDKISIQHEAKNREGFALGAVLAAEFLMDRKGIFTMSDVLKI